MDSFNGLTPAQAERLAMLAEEAGEIVQIVGKILRHGMYSYHPNNPRKSNAELLGGEVADLLAVIKQMSDTGDGIYAPSTYEVELALARKLKYSHHQGVYEAAAISALNTITPMLTAPLRADAVLAHPAALALLQDQINQLEQDLSVMRDNAEGAYRRGYVARRTEEWS